MSLDHCLVCQTVSSFGVLQGMGLCVSGGCAWSTACVCNLVRVIY